MIKSELKKRQAERDKINKDYMAVEAAEVAVGDLCKEYIAKYTEFRPVQVKGGRQMLHVTPKEGGEIMTCTLMGCFLDVKRPLEHDIVLGLELHDGTILEISTETHDVKILKRMSGKAVDMTAKTNARKQRAAQAVQVIESDGKLPAGGKEVSTKMKVVK